jgi:Tol biopolymer transport system component
MKGRTRSQKAIAMTIAGALIAIWIFWGFNQVQTAQATSDCAGTQKLCYNEAVNLGSSINTSAFDGGPSISGDGLVLYFTSGRAGALGQAGGHYDEDLYVSSRESTEDHFGPAEQLGPVVNSTYFDVAPEISADGLALYFVSNRPGGFGGGEFWMGADIWCSTRQSTSDLWGPPKNVGPNVNSPYHDGILSVSADGKTLYWSSNRPDGLGGLDIWMARRDNPSEPFGPAENVGAPINTPGDDFAPEITANEKRLYFASSRPGSVGFVNLWLTTREHKDDPWSEPVSLDTVNRFPFQARPSVWGNGQELFFMSPRPGGFGDFDIWLATRAQQVLGTD